jgi:hypothetical protein
MILLGYLVLSIIILGAWVGVAGYNLDKWTDATRSRLRKATYGNEDNAHTLTVFHICWIGIVLFFFWPVALPCILIFWAGRRLAK